ncbi:TspO/MBR family protein [Nocardia sp. 348MFTsu5.1]|uniref:TspO/MBR family protein n=1 Tax=Nocardia sp. 348MFTsu5.1 TaxID=1172185 RepID=UPI0003617B8D|nr:TspO/MBR family protein [Nocardia sp. 348MFTsu5.1]
MRSIVKTSGAVAITAVVGSIAAQDARNSYWYRRLSKPPFQPPARLFPIVWTALYADVAISSAATIDALNDDIRHIDAAAFEKALAVNLILNGAWTWVFFKAHRTGAATLLAAALTASSADLVRRAAPASITASAALMPYAGWCGFATMLSGAIWRRNR